MQKNEGKNAFFCQKICTCQKKAVPLHSLLKSKVFAPRKKRFLIAFEIEGVCTEKKTIPNRF